MLIKNEENGEQKVYENVFGRWTLYYTGTITWPPSLKAKLMFKFQLHSIVFVGAVDTVECQVPPFQVHPRGFT